MDIDLTYELAYYKQLIKLCSESEFRKVILETTNRERGSIQVYSPLPTHDLFDHDKLRTICSGLGRRTKFRKIEILVFKLHRMIKNGYTLLNIARKLPASIQIKVVDPEVSQQ